MYKRQAIDDVAREPWDDRERMGCVGASYGGYSVYFLAGCHEKRFKAFISHCGIFDFDSMYGETEELFFVNNDYGGPYWDTANATAQRSYANSPHKFVSKWDTPILIITGEKDFRIPYTQSLEAFTAARTLGIPAIVGMGDALKPELEGRAAIADGSTGALVIDPDDDTRDRLLKKRDEQLRLQRLLETLKGQANVTKDGKTIRIYCNIGSPEDVHAVQVNDGGGIGLFRSEFLYLNTTDYPTEDQQFEAYKQVLSDMDGKEVIIRTLDIGADKQLSLIHI